MADTDAPEDGTDYTEDDDAQEDQSDGGEGTDDTDSGSEAQEDGTDDTDTDEDSGEGTDSESESKAQEDNSDGDAESQEDHTDADSQEDGTGDGGDSGAQEDQGGQAQEDGTDDDSGGTADAQEDGTSDGGDSGAQEDRDRPDGSDSTGTDSESKAQEDRSASDTGGNGTDSTAQEDRTPTASPQQRSAEEGDKVAQRVDDLDTPDSKRLFSPFSPQLDGKKNDDGTVTITDSRGPFGTKQDSVTFDPRTPPDKLLEQFGGDPAKLSPAEQAAMNASYPVTVKGLDNAAKDSLHEPVAAGGGTQWLPLTGDSDMDSLVKSWDTGIEAVNTAVLNVSPSEAGLYAGGSTIGDFSSVGGVLNGMTGNVTSALDTIAGIYKVGSSSATLSEKLDAARAPDLATWSSDVGSALSNVGTSTTAIGEGGTDAFTGLHDVVKARREDIATFEQTVGKAGPLMGSLASKKLVASLASTDGPGRDPKAAVQAGAQKVESGLSSLEKSASTLVAPASTPTAATAQKKAAATPETDTSKTDTPKANTGNDGNNGGGNNGGNNSTGSSPNSGPTSTYTPRASNDKDDTSTRRTNDTGTTDDKQRAAAKRLAELLTQTTSGQNQQVQTTPQMTTVPQTTQTPQSTQQTPQMTMPQMTTQTPQTQQQNQQQQGTNPTTQLTGSQTPQMTTAASPQGQQLDMNSLRQALGIDTSQTDDDRRTSKEARAADSMLTSRSAPQAGDGVRRTQFGGDMRPLDTDGDGKMDRDAVPPTREEVDKHTDHDGEAAAEIKIDGKTYDVKIGDPRLLEMMNLLGAQDPGDHLGVLDAAKKAGIDLSSYGTLLEDPTQAKTGDVVVSSKGEGMYLGDGYVLMDDGEVKPLGDVLELRPPNSGIFHLELPDLPEGSGHGDEKGDHNGDKGGPADGKGGPGPADGGDKGKDAPAVPEGAPAPGADGSPPPVPEGAPAPNADGSAPAHPEGAPADGSAPAHPEGAPADGGDKDGPAEGAPAGGDDKDGPADGASTGTGGDKDGPAADGGDKGASDPADVIKEVPYEGHPLGES